MGVGLDAAICLRLLNLWLTGQPVVDIARACWSLHIRVTYTYVRNSYDRISDRLNRATLFGTSPDDVHA